MMTEWAITPCWIINEVSKERAASTSKQIPLAHVSGWLASYCSRSPKIVQR